MSAIIRGKPEEESQQKMANLLFQLVDHVVGKDVLGVNSALVDRFCPAPFPCEVIFSLGAVDGITYYCKSNELFRHHPRNFEDSSALHVQIVPRKTITADIALGIADEIRQQLNLLQYTRSEPGVSVHKGYVVMKYLVPSTDGMALKWGFELVMAVSPERAKDVINSWKGIVWQKRLQRMEKIALYDPNQGRWISLQKNLSPDAADVRVLDIQTAGIIETVLEFEQCQEASQTT